MGWGGGGNRAAGCWGIADVAVTYSGYSGSGTASGVGGGGRSRSSSGGCRCRRCVASIFTVFARAVKLLQIFPS